VFGFLIAGHDTTSTTVLWALKVLADNPEQQKATRSALETAFPEALKSKRNPTAKEITDTRVPYMDALMEELLRCVGTIPLIDRQATCDTEILGHRIKKGTIVLFLGTGPSLLSPAFEIPESQRSASSRAAKADGKERRWDPEDIRAFKPERWLTTSSAGSTEFNATAGPQLAFGLGTRGCFGKRLAYMELRIILTLIFWNFELMRCPTELSGYTALNGITNKPTQCYVRLRKLRS
jgi:cytochrome P450